MEERTDEWRYNKLIAFQLLWYSEHKITNETHNKQTTNEQIDRMCAAAADDADDADDADAEVRESCFCYLYTSQICLKYSIV